MERDNLCISWKNLPWKLFERKIFHLQCKIYEAKKSGNYRLVKRLQKLLIHSKSSHFIATRVLEKSCKDYTLSEHEKYALACGIRSSLKEDFLLSNFRLCGYFRNLEFRKVLVIQYILRLTLEPLYYEKSDWLLWRKGEISFALAKKFSSSVEKAFSADRRKVLKFEISPSLVNVKYSLLVKQISLPIKYRLFIYKSLTTNFCNQFTAENGLAVFLRNILVRKVNNFFSSHEYPSLQKENSNLDKFILIYSNTVVCFLRYKDNFYDLVDRLKSFLTSNGLFMKLSSIHISALDEGFDFSGWFFKKQTDKKIFISFSRTVWIWYKKLFKLVLSRNYSSIVKIRKMNFLKKSLIHAYPYISRSVLKSKSYFIKRSIFKYSKTLKFLNKKFLFESFRFKFSK